MTSTQRRSVAVGTVLAGALALTGCVENSSGQSGTQSGSASAIIAVTATDETCEVAADTTTSGATTFQITNGGSQTTEFYLLGEDGLRIVGERENIAPGASADLVVTLQPGSYFTACKPGMRGANVGEATFTVGGDPIELSASQQEQFDEVVTNYINFVKNEVAELLPLVEDFANAYMAGDDDKAREMYADVRVHYERIEPIAEALGTLDPRIDYREIDYLAEADLLAEDDPEFTEWLGFHRIEKDLWPPAEGTQQPDRSDARESWSESSTEDRQRIGKQLIVDVQELYDTVHSDSYIEDQQIDISTVSNGAASLLEEVAVTKVTGEENWWSHYDLWDFQANVQGSRIAFDLVAPIAKEQSAEGAELVEDINARFDDLQAALDKYGNLDDGYVLYDQVSSEQQRELVNLINAAREPLSKLTGTVLGIQ